MYTPQHFAETDPETIAAFIRENAFGVMVSVVDGKATASQIPFLYEVDTGVLLGHVARANPQWQELSSAQDVLVIFQGPHAYVSPTWYKGAGVPTWNYATVQVRGTATTFDDPERLRQLLARLTDRYEATRPEPWSGDYNPRMLEQIVGIEISITECQAKFKLSQNRPLDDRRAVAEKLGEAGLSDSQRLAAMMEKDL